jgi:hypothetical protein
MALLALLVVGLAWCSATEDEAPEAPSEPTAVFVPTPELIQSAEEDAGSPAAEDAGTAPAPKSDPSRPTQVTARREPDLADYMRRWREALAPLFMNGINRGSPTLFRAAPQEPAASSPESGADAGVVPCTPKRQRLEFQKRVSTDLVVVVDTSGSMRSALPKIVEWLAELEFAIVKSQFDVQLLVVADQRGLGARRPDGGMFNAQVGSTDALDVLLRAGSRWTKSLRLNAELHIVLVTDDHAQGTVPNYVAGLVAATAGVKFSVHLLGGLDTPGHALLSSDQPVMGGICSGDGITGVAAGEVYQEVVRLTEGLRAPLCSPEGRQALSKQLLEQRAPSAPCGWMLESPRHRVAEVDAVSPGKPSTALIPERLLSNCYATRRSYLVADRLLALCEDTCAALKNEGYDAIEVKLECVE